MTVGFREKMKIELRTNVACHAIIFRHSHSITTHEYVQREKNSFLDDLSYSSFESFPNDELKVLFQTH